MSSSLKKFLAAFVVAVTLGAALLFSFLEQGREAGSSPTGMRVEKLVIEKQAGGTQKFEVEVATTPQELEMGLMYRTQMDPDHGMLFQLPEIRVYNFWMKNTLIPLDIIYIAPDGTIAKIAENTTPQSLANVGSDIPVNGALELNGGRAKATGIAVGDKVKHPYFTAPAPKP